MNQSSNLASLLAKTATQAPGVYSFLKRNQKKFLENKDAEFINDTVLQVSNLNGVADDCFNLLTHKPTIGIYGASQAGKSYLVSTMSTGGSSMGTVTWENVTLNFQEHLDQKGNNTEASSLVTRFVSDKYNAPKGYPAKMQLLNEIDLIKICTSAFFNDLDYTEVSDKVEAINENFVQKLNEFAAKCDQNAYEHFTSVDDAKKRESPYENAESDCVSLKQNQSTNAIKIVNAKGEVEYCYFSPLDVINLGKFIEQTSEGKIKGPNKAKDMWLKFSEVLPFLPLEDRQNLLSHLWVQNKNLSHLFNEVSNVLAKFNGATTVYIPRKAFVNEVDGKLQSRVESIMAVQSMHNMFDSNNTKVTVAVVKSKTDNIEDINNSFSSKDLLNSEGFIDEKFIETIELKEGMLSAIGKEVIFVIDNAPAFLQKFDVLDFPGARTRVGSSFENAEKEVSAGNYKNTTQMLIRGKVDLLFGSYVERKQLNKLIICIANGNQNVKELLPPLENWINTTIGKNKQERDAASASEMSKVPLYICFTKFDIDFGHWVDSLKSGSEAGVAKNYNSRIEHLSGTKWFKEWTSLSSFKNCYILRNPTAGGNVWVKSNDNPDEKFCKLDESLNEYIIKARAELENSPYKDNTDCIQRRIDSFFAEDGGVRALVEDILAQGINDYQLFEFAKEKLKASQLQNLLDGLKDYANPDAKEKLDERIKDRIWLSESLLQVCLKFNCFYMIRDVLQLDLKFIEKLSANGHDAAAAFTREVFTKYKDMLDKLIKRCDKLSRATSDADFEISLENSTRHNLLKLERDMLKGIGNFNNSYDLIYQLKCDQVVTICNLVGNQEYKSDGSFLVGVHKTAFAKSNAFFMSSKGEFLESYEVKAAFAKVLGGLFKVFYEVICDEKFNFGNRLYNRVVTLFSTTANDDLNTVRREAETMLSEFTLYAGTSWLSDEYTQFANVPCYYKVMQHDGRFWPESLVDQPQGLAFKYSTINEDAMGLPILNEESKNPTFNLICNFVSCITHIAKVVTGDSSQNIVLDLAENELICRYVANWKALTATLN